MEVKFVNKSAFTLLGKQGSGSSSDGKAWIPPLWEQANSSFMDIFPLTLRDRLGKPQIWGAMSDVDLTFAPWDERGGLYLAGAEVSPEAEAPDGWTKWNIPAFRYAVTEYTNETYDSVFGAVLNEYLPKEGLSLVGAVHEYYATSGALELWFPVEKL